MSQVWWRWLLDDLVGALQQRLRHFEAERLGGFQVDNQIELGRPLNRQVSWTGSLKNPSGVNSALVIPSCDARAITDQTARNGKIAPSCDRWIGMSRCLRGKLLVSTIEKRIGHDDERIAMGLDEGIKSSIDLLVAAGF